MAGTYSRKLKYTAIAPRGADRNKIIARRENAQHTQTNQKMADNDVNMGWGDADEVHNDADGDARAGGAVPDGADGGIPGGGGEQEEAEEIGDSG